MHPSVQALSAETRNVVLLPTSVNPIQLPNKKLPSQVHMVQNPNNNLTVGS
jgi:hypothetical protein